MFMGKLMAIALCRASNDLPFEERDLALDILEIGPFDAEGEIWFRDCSDEKEIDFVDVGVLGRVTILWVTVDLS